MSKRSEYAPGEFCWVDLATTDVDGAKEFYSHLLGIDAEAAPGDPEEGLLRQGVRLDRRPPTRRRLRRERGRVDRARLRRRGRSSASGRSTVGRLATLVDPQGAVVSVFESHYPEPR
jgi:catechol 2,3-dioxygenase-like lactoylglutathione lyase family enzyme